MSGTPVELVTGYGVPVVDVQGGASSGNALRTTNRPNEYGTLGHYSVTAFSGSIAAGATANTQVFYCRNTSATNLIVLEELSIDGMFATTAFAVGAIALDAYFARSFTAENGTPGQTALTITGNNGKMRTSMGTTSIAVIRISNTGTIADPVWTLDSQPFGSIKTHSSGGPSSATPIIGSIFLPRNDLFLPWGREHPIVMAQNEGIAIMATVPATGVWKVGVRMKWSEVTAF